MNPKVDAYLKKAKKWQPEMTKLRAILLDCPFTEEFKWNKPCYTFQESNVVIMVDFKNYCTLIFCKGVLLKDPKRLLIKPGENTQAARQLRLTSVPEIVKLTSTLKAYFREAIAVEKSGLEVKYKKTSEIERPTELEKKFKESPAVKTAFEALTPGRQRAYLIHFSAAKQSQTRTARIEKCAPEILKGRGLNDDYKR